MEVTYKSVIPCHYCQIEKCKECKLAVEVSKEIIRFMLQQKKEDEERSEQK